MFISEDMKDLIDEIECHPDRWVANDCYFNHREKKLSFWIPSGLLCFREDNGMNLGFFEKRAVWKAISRSIKFKHINNL